MIYTNVYQCGNNILYRGYDSSGTRIQRRVRYKPYLFIPDNNPAVEYRTIHNKPVKKLNFDTMSAAKEFLKKYENVSGFECHGLNRFSYTYINDNFPSVDLSETNFIKTAYLDIEVYSADGFPHPEAADKMITSIALSDGAKCYVFAMGDFTPEDDSVIYWRFADEKKMLTNFLRFWRDRDFDIVTGWNVDGFDLPYLYNRMCMILGEEMARGLSPWKLVDARSFFDSMGRKNTAAQIRGIATLDYLQLYMKFTYNKKEQYNLDYIAQEELKEKKVDYKELGYTSLHDLYSRNHQLFIEYNIKDVQLVQKLESKLKFIKQAMAIAYDAKINLEDCTTSVLLWDIIIHNHLFKRKVVIPLSVPGNKSKQIAGAYVKDPEVGLYDWLISFDLDSLYPHLIMMFNISPETFSGMVPGIRPEIVLNDDAWERHAKHAKKNDIAIAANGACFTRGKKGFLPELMQLYYEDRKKYKQMMLDCQKKLEEDIPDDVRAELEAKVVEYYNIQMAKKIALNSAYGALSNQWFRFYNDELAEAITLSGQVAIRWAENKLNQYMNKILKTNNKEYVIAADTDSNYLNVNDIVTARFGKEHDVKPERIVEFLDKMVETKIQPYIDSFYEELAERVNARTQAMHMKREAIAEKALWTGSKRYALLVWNNEGVSYKQAKVKIVGLESVRSSTPSSCRGAIAEVVRVILEGTQEDLYAYIESFREQFYKEPIAAIARNSSVKDLNKYKNKQKGVPMHVFGALLYNNLVDDHKLTNKYNYIRDGDKIKFISLKLPNPARAHVISFVDGHIPKEFSLDKYIDYDEQFRICFMKPCESIASAAKLNVERISTLEDFFV